MAVDEENSECSVCKLIVNDDDNALFCDGFCRTWFHIQCVKVPKDIFENIGQLHEYIQWTCEVCLKRIDNMRSYVCSTEDYLNLHEMIGKLIKVTKDITKDNLDINNKLALIQEQNKILTIRLTSKETPEVKYAMTAKIIADDNNMTNSTASEWETNDTELPSVINHAGKSPLDSPCERTDAKDRREKRRFDHGSPIDTRSDRPIEVKTVTNNEKKNKVNLYSNVVRLRKEEGNSDLERLVSTPQEKLAEEDQPYKKVLSRKELKKNNINSEVKNSSPNQQKDKPNQPQHRKSFKVTVGSGGNELTGVKRAWFHLSRVKSETTEEEVRTYLEGKFPTQKSFIIEKQESKGRNASFKIGADFHLKDDMMDGSFWPRNVVVKRFLFWKEKNPQTN